MIIVSFSKKLIWHLGVLVAEVNTVEPRGSVNWVGINAGSNINCYLTLYHNDIFIIYLFVYFILFFSL